MSLADELMTEVGAPLIAEYFGEQGAVEYFDLDGTSRGTFAATIGGEHSEEVLLEGGEKRSWKQVRHVNFFRHADLPFWKDNAPIGTFRIGVWQYAYEAVESVTANFAVVRLVRLGTMEKARADYRRK